MEAYDRIAPLYDLEHQALVDDIELYLNLARRTGGPVLEAGCGTGRVLRALADAGFEATGVDSSPAMLAIARTQLAGLEDRITVVESDVRDLDLDRRFQLAIYPLDGLLHLLTIEEQAAALGAIRRHLTDGGLLVLDLPNPVAFSADEDGRVILHWTASTAAGGSVSKFISRQVDPIRQIETVDVWYDEVEPGGSLRRTSTELKLRYLHRYELTLLLERAGYLVEHVYGSYDLDELDSASERMIVVARRSEAA